jgi:8-oxo-dGTP pyrophosphatase MutT (NUDIX family)
MDQLNTIDAINAMLARAADDGSSDFDLNPEIMASWPDMKNLRPAAVLIPVIQRNHGLNVILTKRASHLKHHPGQIAFPGGKVDAGDASETAAALREAHEEIGLTPDNVEVLGHLPFHETVTHFQITPIIGRVKKHFTPTPEPGEVAEVFEVPLSHLTNPANYIIEGRYWGGAKRLYYVVPYGPYYIWGATARMLRGFAERLAR